MRVERNIKNIFEKAQDMSFLEGYEGKWVFVVSEDVKESGNSPKEVIEKIGKKFDRTNIKKKFLFKVPTSKERLFVV